MHSAGLMSLWTLPGLFDKNWKVHLEGLEYGIVFISAAIFHGEMCRSRLFLDELPDCLFYSLHRWRTEKTKGRILFEIFGKIADTR